MNDREKNFLINSILPTVGETIDCKKYIEEVYKLMPTDPYRRYKALGSLGGALNASTISVLAGVITRLK